MDSDYGFEIIDHPSDVGIRVVAGSIEKLFELAAAGMFSLMTEIGKVEPAVTKKVRITGEPGSGIEGLFIYWLEKLLYLYEVQKMLFSEFKVLRIMEKDCVSRNTNALDKCDMSLPEYPFIEAKIYGEKIDLDKHEILVSVKAPTYHMLEIIKEKDTGLWKGQVIFDV